jgi:transposase
MFDINEMLVDKLEELDNKISKNSRNSSRPPSKDENTPQRNQSLRGKSGKKSGGQDGHSGSTLKKVETPDKIIQHHLKGKCTCGQILS